MVANWGKVLSPGALKIPAPQPQVLLRERQTHMLGYPVFVGMAYSCNIV